MALVDADGRALGKMSEERRRALRSHDITHGLQNVDARNAAVSKLEATRVIGWSAAIAGNLREQQVEDLEALKAVAAQTMGVEPFAFKDVLRTLEETELATVQKRRGGKDILYVNNIAAATMYDRLGEQWSRSEPTEFDAAMVGVLDSVATTPKRASVLRSELGLDADTHDLVLALGGKTQLLRTIKDDDGEDFVYTPFYAFENADAIVKVLKSASDEEVARAFDAVRAYQGLSVGPEHPVLQGAVAAGLIAAPTIDGVTGSRSFAVLPFSVPPELRLIKKTVLEKAQAILAAVRYGENFGRDYKIQWPLAVLRALVDKPRGRKLQPHPEHGTQYFVLAQLRIVRLVRSGNWFGVELIDTEDNVEAVTIAIDLIRHGELVDHRLTDRADMQALVESSKDYHHPLYAIDQQRPRVPLPDKIVYKMLESIQGGSPVV